MAKPTIRTIAQEAGVSTATVSKALNDMPDISVEVKMRIRQIAKRQGYVLNVAARQLASGHSFGIGVILPDLAQHNDALFYVALAERLQRAGYVVFLGNSRGDMKAEASMVTDMMQKGVGVLLIMTATSEMRHIASVTDGKTPVIYMGGAVNPYAEYSVKCDDYMGGMQAAHVLRAGGSRRVSVLTWGAAATPQHERVRGFLSQMQEYGIPVKVRQVSDYLSEEAGWRMAQEVLRDNQEDGVYATDDLLAIGAISALLEKGVRVPEDMQIVGYGDAPMASLALFKLTTIALPTSDMANCASDMTLALMRTQEDMIRKLVLEPKIVLRATTRVRSIP